MKADGIKTVPAARQTGEKTCPQCGAAFVCGMAAGEGKCWCADLPAVMPLPGTESGCGCYCPDCLRALIARQTQDAASTSQE